MRRGCEDQVNRIADRQVVAGNTGGDDAIRLAITAGDKFRRVHGESLLIGHGHAISLRWRRGLSRTAGKTQKYRVSVVQ